MEKLRKIVKLNYRGEMDEAGLPHGKGEIRYIVEPESNKNQEGIGDICYEGEFVHGLRHGDGELQILGMYPNPVSEYEWYSEGEYDGCGRLIFPSHRSGSYEPFLPMWYRYFQGTWKNDMPQKSRWKDGPLDIDRTIMKIIRNTRFKVLKETFVLDFRNN